MWKKTNINSDIIPIEKTTPDETTQYATALTKLRNEKSILPSCEYVHFNKPVITLTGTVCQLNNPNNIEIPISLQTKSADSGTFEGFTMEKSLFFWDDFHGKLCKNDNGKMVYVANFECVIVNEIEDVTREQSTLYVEIVVIFKLERLSLKVKKTLLSD